MASPKSEQIQALGRPFKLGSLYDIRRDQMINRSLWNQSEMTEIASTPQPFNDFKVEASNTIKDSLELMDMSASLTMSFMGGMVDVSGSAAFLDKKNTKSNTTSVTMMHYMTTENKSLGEEQLSKVTHTNLLELEEATHVITGITYGARAFFKFEKTVGVHETEQDVSGSLKIAVKSIPSFHIAGEAEVKMTDNEKKNTEEISCQFVGDYINIGIPSNFEESINIFNAISKPKDNENRKVVPITVYLTPIQQLDSNAARLVREISKNAVDQCTDLMNYFRDVETKLNTLKLSKTSQNFPEFADFVEKVDGQFKTIANDLKRRMSDILPKIRGGGNEEQELIQIIADFETTIFTSEYFDKWFKLQEDEVKTTDDFLKFLEERKVQVVKTRGELRRTMNTEKDGIVALTAGFVSFQDKQLLVDLKENSKEHPAEYDYPAHNTNVWMNDDAFYGKVHKQREDLLHALEHNEEDFVFLFDLRYGVEENYCTTKLYKGGVGVVEDLDLSNSENEFTNVDYNESSDQLEGSVDSGLTFGQEIQYKSVKDADWLPPVERIPQLSPGVYEARMRCVLNDQGMVGKWSKVVTFRKKVKAAVTISAIPTTDGITEFRDENADEIEDLINRDVRLPCFFLLTSPTSEDHSDQVNAIKTLFAENKRVMIFLTIDTDRVDREVEEMKDFFGVWEDDLPAMRILDRQHNPEAHGHGPDRYIQGIFKPLKDDITEDTMREFIKLYKEGAIDPEPEKTRREREIEKKVRREKKKEEKNKKTGDKKDDIKKKK